jgi:hypothetical protein
MAFITLFSADGTVPFIWLYIGPDVLLPLTSAFAAIVGLLLMFWNKVVGVARTVWRAVFRRGAE